MDQKNQIAALIPNLPAGSWRKVVVSTLSVTLVVNLLAVLGTLLANVLVGRPSVPVDIYSSIALATGFTLPLFGTLQIKLAELALVNAQLQIHATTDFLTAALNRRAFIEAVEERLIKRPETSPWSDPALLVIDVDNFKIVNDSYGHQVGDLALVRIADTLRSNLRQNDLFGRLGGEEFGIFLDNMTAADALRFAEQCRLAVMDCPFTPQGQDHRLTVSIGIAIGAENEDFSTLFQDADHLLYQAKASGRNRVESPRISVAA